MIERNIDKNSWRLNLPAELMEKLNWNKGDSLLLDIQEDKLVVIKANEEMIKRNKEEQLKIIKENSDRKRIRPKKQTPCGLFEFSKRKYAENKCKKCNADYELLMQNPGIHCPVAEENYKQVVEDIAKNLDNENRITLKDTKNIIDISSRILKTNKKIAETIDDINETTEYIEIKEVSNISKLENEEMNKQVERENIKLKLKELTKEYKEIAETKIEFLSNCSNEDKIKFSRQMICPMCENEMIENSGIIRNNKLICKNCRNKIFNEMKKVCKLHKEIKELKRKEEELK